MPWFDGVVENYIPDEIMQGIMNWNQFWAIRMQMWPELGEL